MRRNWLIYTAWFIFMLVFTSCTTMTGEHSRKEAEAFRRVGEAYLQQGNLASAMKELKKAEAKYPNDYLLQYDLGLIYYSRGRFDEAISHYKKAVELKPDFGPAINSLGNAYAGKKDWDQAIFYYNKVITDILYATPYFTYAGLGNAYYYKVIWNVQKNIILKPCRLSPSLSMRSRVWPRPILPWAVYPKRWQSSKKPFIKPRIHRRCGFSWHKPISWHLNLKKLIIPTSKSLNWRRNLLWPTRRRKRPEKSKPSFKKYKSGPSSNTR
jgi:tetratricopeptide (TPR) repeat protein